MSLDWQAKALCRDYPPELFFDKAGNGRFVYEAAAKSICRECCVRSQCCDDAMVDKGRCGIWGGLSEQDRIRVRKERKSDEEEFIAFIQPAIERIANSVREETMRKLQGVLS
jgi:WhiB family redox-sensing transcriptional regulator